MSGGREIDGSGRNRLRGPNSRKAPCNRSLIAEVDTIHGLSIGRVMNFGYSERVVEHNKTRNARSGFAIIRKSAALFLSAPDRGAAAFANAPRYRKCGYETK